MTAIKKYIEQNIISFNDTLLKKYKSIGLKETEVVILCKLYTLHQINNKDIPIKELTNEMTLSENDLSMYIISLIERGYINLKQVNNHEEYDLNGVIERLSKALEEEQNANNKPSKKDLIQNICNYYESMTKKIVNANDLTFINRWLDEGRTLEEIKNGILSSVKLNKTSINYIDAVINSKTRKKEENNDEINQELLDVLEDINVRRK